MNHVLKQCRWIWLVAFVLSARDVAFAQTTAQFPLQFDFLTPGARSLALGSAFIGLADDATAAVTNPAGLLSLAQPEVSIEGRYRGFDNPFLSAGRISGTVTNTGEDTISGPRYSVDRDSSFNVSFLSFVYPKSRWAVALFTHQPTTIKNDFLYRGVFERATVAGQTINDFRDNPLTGSRDISIRHFGGTVAVRANSAVTAGVGVSVYRFNLDASFARLGLTSIPFGAPNPAQIGSTAVQAGEDTALGMISGVQIQVAPQVKVGAIFRLGPSFDYTQTDAVPGRATLVRDGSFKVPDSFGLGLAWRPTDAAMLSVDYVFTRHSQIKTDFVDFQAISTGTEDQLVVDDSGEFHTGLEYVLTNVPGTPALRVGLWWDPDHSVRYESEGSTIDSQTDFRFQNILPGGEDVFHYTGGIGLPLSRIFELSGAIDYSSRGTIASFSTIVRF